MVRKEFARLGACVTRQLEGAEVLEAMLRLRAVELVDCTEGSPEKAEMAAIAGLLNVYETGATTSGGGIGVGNG
jgi:hypothetical protein